MTFENDHTCVKCPNAVYGGSVLFRSCSLANRNSVEGSMFIECNKRPELGFFEPSIRTEECPVMTGIEFAVLD